MSDKKKKQAIKAVNKSKKNAGKGGSKKGVGAKGIIFLIILSLAGAIFMPTSLLLLVGMLPSIVAVFVSSTGHGARASTVTAMNIAGCIPFVFKLWSGENDFDASITIISDMQSLIVMYTAAAFGYMIDWLVTGLVSSFLYQKGIKRMETIKERQAVLLENWGQSVTGVAPVKKPDGK